MAARFPKIGISSDGDRIMAWFVYNSGSSGPGTIQAQYRGQADTSWSAPFTFEDAATSTNLAIAELGWGDIDHGKTHDDPWEITIVISTEAAPSWWKSWDNARTWKRVTP